MPRRQLLAIQFLRRLIRDWSTRHEVLMSNMLCTIIETVLQTLTLPYIGDRKLDKKYYTIIHNSLLLFIVHCCQCELLLH